MLANAERFSLVGKTAVVTGAAGLLGREHVRALVTAGATVVATDRDVAACEHAVGPFRDESAAARIHTFAADITVPESLERLADHAFGLNGRLDVLVNNAALNDKFESDGDAARNSRFETYPLELFRRVLDVNVTGTFLTSQILGRRMLEQQSGSIINIGSTYGLVGPDQRIYRQPDRNQTFWKSPAYPASKGAVLAFTRFLATTWAAHGIRVNSLTPGGISDPSDRPIDEEAGSQKRFFVDQYSRRTPLGRMGRPDELAGALIFLASDASSYVTGANVVVDGGWTAW